MVYRVSNGSINLTFSLQKLDDMAYISFESLVYGETVCMIFQ